MRIILTVLLALVSALPSLAQEGSQLYRLHCATCHGAAADGKGPMAPVLLVQPPDLTTLAQRNGGDFPRWRVLTRLDGRDPLVAHGSDMPVFGPWFEGEPATLKLRTGQPVITSRPIVELLEYLEIIQQKGG